MGEKATEFSTRELLVGVTGWPRLGVGLALSPKWPQRPFPDTPAGNSEKFEANIFWGVGVHPDC